MGKEKTMILNTTEKLKEAVDLIYQQKRKEAFDALNIVLGELMTAMDELFAYKVAHEDFEMDEGRLINSLKECIEATEAEDYILVADVFQYDLVEYMEQIAAQME